MKFNSNDVNYLIYRYLLEAGYGHTAFAFAHESSIASNQFLQQKDQSTNVDDDLNQIQSGALLKYLHKGLTFEEIETHTLSDGTTRQCNEPFSLVKKHICSLSNESKSIENSSTSQSHHSTSDVDISQSIASTNHHNITNEINAKQPPPTSQSLSTSGNGKKRISTSTASKSNSSSKSSNTSLSSNQNVFLLTGHQAEVFTCSWNWNYKHSHLLATGAGDSTARIWDISLVSSSVVSGGGYDQSLILNTQSQNPIPSSSSSSNITSTSTNSSGSSGGTGKLIITTLEWDPTGNLLAAGTSEGAFSIWSLDGSKISSIHHHSASIFALRWSPSGKFLLVGSEDSRLTVWSIDTETIETCHLIKEYPDAHSGSVLDADWKSEEEFASCSQDRTIRLFTLNSNPESNPDPDNDDQPPKQKLLLGHEEEINTIRWNPSKNLLASCADDKTCRIWQPNNLHQPQLHSLTGHTDGIYTLAWNPLDNLTLTTASFDTTARIWNAETGQCMHVLMMHSKPVYSLAYNPEGSLLVTGSVDKSVLIWNVDNGLLEGSYTCRGGVYDLNWDLSGKYIAVCTTKNQVLILERNSFVDATSSSSLSNHMIN